METDATPAITAVAAGSVTAGGRPYTLTAVPEPGTLLLGAIAAACGGGGLWWRRKQKQPVVAPDAEVNPAL